MTTSFVFLISLGRSGSTFVKEVVAALGIANCYPLEWNVGSIYQRVLGSDGRATVGQFIAEYRSDTKRVDQVVQELSHIDAETKWTLEEFLDQVRNVLFDSQKTFFIKTTDLENLWLYKRHFPGARFILNVRHPIDYIHSWHLFWMKSGYSLYPKHWTLPLHLGAINRIGLCFLQAFVYQHDRNCMALRLEDIDVRDPASLANWLRGLEIFIAGETRRSNTEYEAFAKCVRLNESTAMPVCKKDKTYAEFGLTPAEINGLTESRPFIQAFYQTITSDLAKVKQCNLFARFFSYYVVANRAHRMRAGFDVLRKILASFRA